MKIGNAKMLRLLGVTGSALVISISGAHAGAFGLNEYGATGTGMALAGGAAGGAGLASIVFNPATLTDFDGMWASQTFAFVRPNVVDYSSVYGNTADLADGKQWLNTGDLGRCDADGYFWLTGRKKELIIRGGHNIDPAAIEEPLHRHPAVQICAAVGRPDAHAGELPVAYAQLKPGAKATERELVEFVRERIGEPAAAPRRIRIVDAMPLTAVGKIFKPELKRRETLDALQSALIEAGTGRSGARGESQSGPRPVRHNLFDHWATHVTYRHGLRQDSSPALARGRSFADDLRSSRHGEWRRETLPAPLTTKMQQQSGIV